MISQKPLVSIWCPVYNHEKFIEKCIEGFVMQKTNFLFEIVIHDDASIDNSVKIINKYEKKHPELIRGIYQKANQFSRNSAHLFETLIQECKGKYIAICEGDDYWTDPFKLQKQVSFLEKNSDYIICSHNHVNVDEKGEVLSNRISDIHAFQINELAQGRFIQTLTVLFRNNKQLIHDILNFDGLPPMADFVIFMVLSKIGKIAILPDIMAARRVHSGGIYSSKSEKDRYKGFVETTKIVNKYYNGRYRKDLFVGKTNALYGVFLAYAKNGNKCNTLLIGILLLIRFYWTSYTYTKKVNRSYKPRDVFYWIKRVIWLKN